MIKDSEHSELFHMLGLNGRDISNEELFHERQEFYNRVTASMGVPSIHVSY